MSFQLRHQQEAPVLDLVPKSLDMQTGFRTFSFHSRCQEDLDMLQTLRRFSLLGYQWVLEIISILGVEAIRP